MSEYIGVQTIEYVGFKGGVDITHIDVDLYITCDEDGNYEGIDELQTTFLVFDNKEPLDPIVFKICELPLGVMEEIVNEIKRKDWSDDFYHHLSEKEKDDYAESWREYK